MLLIEASAQKDSFFAACLADTLASELGILSTFQPRLLTTLRSCPKGTNGGGQLSRSLTPCSSDCVKVTAWGLFCSAAGGAVIGLVAVAVLAIESPACRQSSGWPAQVVALSTAAGLLGSLVDSLLGATLQQTLYSDKQRRVVQAKGAGAKAISGVDVLSNDGVNLLSSAGSALLMAWITNALF